MSIGERKKAAANRQRPPSYGHVSFTRTAAASTPTAATSPSPEILQRHGPRGRRRPSASHGPLDQRVHLMRLASGPPTGRGLHSCRQTQTRVSGRRGAEEEPGPASSRIQARSKRGRRIQTSIQSWQGDESRRKVGIAKILRKETAVAAADTLPVSGGHARGSPSHTPTISAPGLRGHHATTSQRKRQKRETHFGDDLSSGALVEKCVVVALSLQFSLGLELAGAEGIEVRRVG